MSRLLALTGVLLFLPSAVSAAEATSRPFLDGLKDPTAAVVGPGGKLYVAVHDGILTVANGKAMPFAKGLEPVALATWGEWLLALGKDRVWRVSRDGKVQVLAAPRAFVIPPTAFSAIDVDETGTAYAADVGGILYSISPAGKVNLIADSRRVPTLGAPSGLVTDGLSHLLILDSRSGTLRRFRLVDSTTVKLADGLGQNGRLAWDKFGRLYIGDRKGGRVFVVPRPGHKPVLLASGLETAAGMCPDVTGKGLLVAETKRGAVVEVPRLPAGWEVDTKPFAVATAPAFPDLQWAGWKPEDDRGRQIPLRPIVLTHAGDGSNRVFVATERGVIHVFPNDQKAKTTRIFLDLTKRVHYDDNQNEEGFLGLAFHPRYKENGEFFVFYTPRKTKLTNVISRFRVSKEDPNRADPASEEVLLKLEKPYWNHNGGTLCFGPDGYLYIAIGDGGAANDPYGNGQNLNTLLGKILRIDVDHKAGGKPYAIPRDNPFVNRKKARPEIWAYGLRNVWRMAFDGKTGKLWASDVGQNLFEEIDLIVKGGNYGWNLREGLHPFGARGAGYRKDLIDPIWEYHHDIGKSNTGGTVYRGKRLPALDGYYLYADYVSTKIWALRYDEAKGRVVANRPIHDPNLAILSFGEDEKGEVYFLSVTATGRGIHWFVRKKQ